MGKTLQKTTGGDLLKTTAGGALQGECCCGTADPCSGVPGVDVTVTWTPGPATYTIFGQTFSPGDTKTICPTNYACTTGALPTYYTPFWYEAWTFTNAAGSLLNFDGEVRGILAQGTFLSTITCFTIADYQAVIGMKAYTGTVTLFKNGLYRNFHTVKVPSCNSITTSTYYTYGTQSQSNISTRIPANATGLDPGVPIQDSAFGQLTTNNGITVTWQRGSFPFNTCGWSTRVRP